MSQKINAIVFSNNSPSNLDIFLQSTLRCGIEVFDFSVLYSAEEEVDKEYLELFERVGINRFSRINNFKEDLLHLINSGDGELTSFFKDTNYFFSQMPTDDIEGIMSDEDVFCFSLGLGRNIKKDALNDVDNVLLNEVNTSECVIKFNWVNHYLSFGRPLELGQGHIFRKKEIFKTFKRLKYSDIISLEESFEDLDYYPREYMSSFNDNVLVDVINSTDTNLQIKDLERYSFLNIDRNIIEIKKETCN